MKTIIITLLLLFTTLSFAGDMTGIGARALLQKNQINLDQLSRQGHQLLLGDLTGVGKNIELNKIKIYLTQNEVILNDKIDFIKIKNNERYFPRAEAHADFKFQDVVDITLPTKQIDKTAIKALIVK